MHELSIAQALIEQIAANLQPPHAPVARVTITVGALSGVDADALHMAFPFAAEDTPVAGAQLIIQHVPAGVRCQDCGVESAPEFPLIFCEACQSANVELISGQELLLNTIELEREDDAAPEH